MKVVLKFLSASGERNNFLVLNKEKGKPSQKYFVLLDVILYFNFYLIAGIDTNTCLTHMALNKSLSIDRV